MTAQPREVGIFGHDVEIIVFGISPNYIVASVAQPDVHDMK